MAAWCEQVSGAGGFRAVVYNVFQHVEVEDGIELHSGRDIRNRSWDRLNCVRDAALGPAMGNLGQQVEVRFKA